MPPRTTRVIVKEYDNYVELDNGTLISKEDLDLLPYILKSLHQDGYSWLRENFPHWKQSYKLHRVIAERMFGDYKSEGKVCDHVNSKKFDCRRENLQLLTNRNNITKDRHNKTSRYYRVSRASYSGHWRVMFTVNSADAQWFGTYKYEDDAGYWADVWAVKLLPEGTLLNNPSGLDHYKQVAETIPYNV